MKTTMLSEKKNDNITKYSIFCGFGLFWATNINSWITQTNLSRVIVYPVLLAVMFCLGRLILNTGHYKWRVSSTPFFFLNILTLLGIFTIFRALLNLNVDSLRDILFGKAHSIITWLMPVFARWGLRKKLWLTVLPYTKRAMWVGFFYVLFAMIFMKLFRINGQENVKMYNSVDILFLSPLFVLFSIHKAKIAEMFLGYMCIGLLLIHVFITGERFAIAYCGLICIFYFFEILRIKSSNTKTIALLSCFIIIIAVVASPIYSKTMDYQYNKYIKQGELFEDTRGNLAEQPLSQMRMYEFFWGKGVLGNYTWWYENENYMKAIYDRVDIELGYMQIWIKGGLLMLGVFYGLCIYAAYLGIFRSNNLITRFFGYMIISRLIVMLTAMIPRLGFEYYFFWLIVGACLSKEFRSITLEESLDAKKIILS